MVGVWVWVSISRDSRSNVSSMGGQMGVSLSSQMGVGGINYFGCWENRLGDGVTNSLESSWSSSVCSFNSGSFGAGVTETTNNIAISITAFVSGDSISTGKSIVKLTQGVLSMVASTADVGAVDDWGVVVKGGGEPCRSCCHKGEEGDLGKGNDLSLMPFSGTSKQIEE